jgi:hypothetical protein
MTNRQLAAILIAFFAILIVWLLADDDSPTNPNEPKAQTQSKPSVEDTDQALYGTGIHRVGGLAS